MRVILWTMVLLPVVLGYFEWCSSALLQGYECLVSLSLSWSISQAYGVLVLVLVGFEILSLISLFLMSLLFGIAYLMKHKIKARISA